MTDNPPPPKRLLDDYGGANAPTGRLTIVDQLVNVANFQLHPSTTNQLERKHFTGKVNEDANKHLQRFLTMSNTLKIDGHTEEAKKLRMFPFTLAEEAEEWLYSLPAGSITSWEEMEKASLNEYFPASVFLRKRCQSKPEGVIDLKLETNKIRIEDTIATEVEKKLKAMNIGTQQVAQVQPAPTEICNGPHQTQQQAPKKADWEIAIERMEAHNGQFQEETRNNQKNTTTSIKNLEVQMGQIAQQLASSSQVQGVLSSATVTNPREHNNVSIVTTRSGKSDEVVEELDEEEDQLIEVDLEIKENEA
ncbi:uncharacterized protein LOC127123046 [Lathyrus oleraceus]|uniref:uncharacterized protein LOC127123046 n=1 Tax=Pisum sativum TaxID=3888 RepID=UPI0021D2D9CD|nr:uncharacterized protein LOC127123046 [Pisum sativum]